MGAIKWVLKVTSADLHKWTLMAEDSTAVRVMKTMATLEKQ